MLFKRSVDAGSSFGNVIHLSNNLEASGDPQIGVSGNKVYVVWDTTDPVSLSIILKKSSDGPQHLGMTRSSPLMQRFP